MPPALFKTERNTGMLAKLPHRIVFGLFLAQWFLVSKRLLSHQRTVSPMHWPEVLLVLFAAANTVATLSRELPWQNVLAASVLIMLICGASEGLAVLAGAPSARFVASGSSWAVPLVWLVAILNARGIARLALFRWRKSRRYGLWLIGLVALLVVLFGIGLHFFCAAYLASSPASISWLHLLVWWVTAALALIAATPWLIDKRPGERLSARQPMITWILLSVLFASATALAGSWPVTAIILGATGIILVVAWRPMVASVAVISPFFSNLSWRKK